MGPQKIEPVDPGLVLAFWCWHADTVALDMVAYTGSPTTLDLIIAWAIKHKQRLLVGSVVAVVLVLAGSIYLMQKARTKETAEAELSRLRPTISAQGDIIPVPASALLKIADNYSQTPAGARARLLAAGALFNEGKFAEAKSQFDRFLRDYRKSPFRADALYGSASCLAAQGKLTEAIALYREIIDRYVGNPIVPRAKLALGRLLAAQNQIEQAKKLFEEVARTEGGGLQAYQAEIELEQLNRRESIPTASTQPGSQTAPQSTASGSSAN